MNQDTLLEKRLKNKRIAYVLNIALDTDNRAQKEIVELLRAGADVIVCTWDKDIDGKDELRDYKIREYNITANCICEKVEKEGGLKANINKLIGYELRQYRWLRRNKERFDYIHCVDMDSAFACSIFSNRFKKKYIYDIFDDYADCHDAGQRVYNFIKRIDSHIIKNAASVIICSEKRKEQLAYKPTNLYVIHNSPDIQKVERNQQTVLTNYKLKIVYVGNLSTGRMILEMADIVSRNINYEFYCGGVGLLDKELKRYDKEYENIHFLGKLTYEEVLLLENNCDVIPALYDPSFKNHKYAAPNKFYESLYLGKPTIMAHNTGMDDIVDEFNTGLTISYTPMALENAFASIYSDLAYWRKQKDRIKQIYAKYYSWDVMRERLIKLYENI